MINDLTLPASLVCDRFFDYSATAFKDLSELPDGRLVNLFAETLIELHRIISTKKIDKAVSQE